MAKDKTPNNSNDPQVQVAKETARQAIIVAIIGAIVSLATVFKDVISPKVEKQEFDKIENKIDESVKESIDSKISNSSKEGSIIIESFPVGTIIPSTLDFEGLCKDLNQPKPSSWNSSNLSKYKWVPADGRNVAGSKYSDLIDTKVIDLRGVFLRGKNQFDKSETNIVPNNQKDPDGIRSSKKLQEDSFQGHKHKSRFPVLAGGQGDGKGTTTTNTNGADNDAFFTIERIINGYVPDGNFGNPRVSSETRPKNFAVNYYIKIN